MNRNCATDFSPNEFFSLISPFMFSNANSQPFTEDGDEDPTHLEKNSSS
jgi:hypothetical protein